mgnify:CR=1 FL=1
MPLGSIKVKGAVDLVYKLDATADQIVHSTKLMRQIGNFMKTRILIRTAKGLDVRGKRFKAYSPSYKKIRERAGLSTSIVDLFFTGSMLGSMKVAARKSRVDIYVSDTKDKKGVSNYLKSEYNQATRKFIGISKKEAAQINKILHSYMAGTIRK